MRAPFFKFVLSACALPMLAHAAQTQAINPVADTFVTSGNPTGNFGAAGGLGISAPGSSTGEFQSVMRFDLAATKAAFDTTFGAGNWQLTSASLKLTAATPNNAIFNANAAGQLAVRWMQDDSWVEGAGMPSTPSAVGVNFNTLPAFLANGVTPLGNFAFPGGNSGSTSNALSLPANFTNDVSAGSLVSLHLLSADAAVSYLFNSRTFGTATSRPELSITADAIPEPAATAIIGLAIPLLRRRTK
ncbi:MAG: hypothetical protein H7Z14_06975 [Anaerolineae bacterium]|nr:hypothetical protein [Phycisphaerae bacterium]